MCISVRPSLRPPVFPPILLARPLRRKSTLLPSPDVSAMVGDKINVGRCDKAS
jgi:hypothetical protein